MRHSARASLLTGAFAFTLALVVSGSLSSPAGACSLAAPSFIARGTATAKHGDVVTFRVDEIEGYDANPRPPSASAVGPTIDVHYGQGDEQYLHVGNDYIVTVWTNSPDRTYGSGVQTAEDTCGGGGTSNADGSEIDTAKRIFGVRVWVAYPIIAVGLLLGAFAAVVVPLRWLSRRRV